MRLWISDSTLCPSNSTSACTWISKGTLRAMCMRLWISLMVDTSTKLCLPWELCGRWRNFSSRLSPSHHHSLSLMFSFPPFVLVIHRRTERFQKPSTKRFRQGADSFRFFTAFQKAVWRAGRVRAYCFASVVMMLVGVSTHQPASLLLTHLVEL